MIARTQAIINHKHIRAPFDGKLGIRKVDPGEYVSPGMPLVSLQSLDPLHADFPLPEEDFKQIYVGQKVRVTVESYGSEIFRGKITAINSKVNEETRNILVQATLPNKDRRLYPGMFANIKVLLPERKHVVTVPQTAIAYSLYGDSVFVIRQEGKDKKGRPTLKVQRQYVTVGEWRAGQVAILEGVEAGQQVVTSGQLKLQNGSRVLIDNSVDLSRPETVAKD